MMTDTTTLELTDAELVDVTEGVRLLHERYADLAADDMPENRDAWQRSADEAKALLDRLEAMA